MIETDFVFIKPLVPPRAESKDKSVAFPYGYIQPTYPTIEVSALLGGGGQGANEGLEGWMAGCVGVGGYSLPASKVCAIPCTACLHRWRDTGCVAPAACPALRWGLTIGCTCLYRMYCAAGCHAQAVPRGAAPLTVSCAAACTACCTAPQGVMRKLYPAELGPLTDVPPTGPSPTLLRVEEWMRVTPRWEELTAKVGWEEWLARPLGLGG